MTAADQVRKCPLLPTDVRNSPAGQSPEIPTCPCDAVNGRCDSDSLQTEVPTSET